MKNERCLIDLDKIKPIDFPSYEMDGLDVVQYLNTLPTVDAVEVVRCKNCVSFNELSRTVGEETGKVYCFGYCYHWDYESGMSPNQVDGEDFCSYGERKDVLNEM